MLGWNSTYRGQNLSPKCWNRWQNLLSPRHYWLERSRITIQNEGKKHIPIFFHLMYDLIICTIIIALSFSYNNCTIFLSFLEHCACHIWNHFCPCGTGLGSNNKRWMHIAHICRIWNSTKAFGTIHSFYYLPSIIWFQNWNT